MILLHVPLFIAASLLTDCLLALAVTALHVRPWPGPLISMYLQYFVGYLVVFRLFFTSHQLPKLTSGPRLRRGDLSDNLTLILCVVSATCVVFAVTLTLYRVIGVDTVARLGHPHPGPARRSIDRWRSSPASSCAGPAVGRPARPRSGRR